MANTKLKNQSHSLRTTEKCSFAGQVPVLFSYFPFVGLFSKLKRTASGYNQQPRAVDPVLPSRTPLITRVQWVFPAKPPACIVLLYTVITLDCYQREARLWKSKVTTGRCRCTSCLLHLNSFCCRKQSTDAGRKSIILKERNVNAEIYPLIRIFVAQ